jgi:DNA-binding transcriptional MerR regulator
MSEKFDYGKWYEQNKEKVAESRHKRYKNDPEYREKVQARARYHYWTKKRTNHLTQEVNIDEVELSSSKTIRVDINNPEDARYGQSVEVPVYDAGQLGKYMGRSAQTIRLWERRGVTPAAFWRNAQGYRLYTEDQVIAYLENKHYLDLPMKSIEHSLFAREIKKSLEEMPDGVKVEEAKDVEYRAVCKNCQTINEGECKFYETSKLYCEKCGMPLKDVQSREV